MVRVRSRERAKEALGLQLVCLPTFPVIPPSPAETQVYERQITNVLSSGCMDSQGNIIASNIGSTSRDLDSAKPPRENGLMLQAAEGPARKE